MNRPMRLLREPLLHFLIIGILLFVLYGIVSGPAPAPVNTIGITPERVSQLAAGFESVRKRPPTDDELSMLVDSFVRDEVYYREALALGLERDDTVIRRRLRQKMEFLTDTSAELLEPQTGEIEEYYQTNVARFQEPAAIALTQVYLGQNPLPDRISEALTALRSDDETDSTLWGEATMLPPELRLSTIAEVDGLFGTGFFDGLMDIPVGYWSGPIQSGFGVHIVRIEERLPGRVLPLDEVRNVTEREWRSDKLKELHELVYARLLQGYTVVMPDHISVKD
jgi:hypothetical protein